MSWEIQYRLREDGELCSANRYYLQARHHREVPSCIWAVNGRQSYSKVLGDVFALSANGMLVVGLELTKLAPISAEFFDNRRGQIDGKSIQFKTRQSETRETESD